MKRLVLSFTILSLGLVCWALARIAEPDACINSIFVKDMVIQKSDRSWTYFSTCDWRVQLNPWVKKILVPHSEEGRRLHFIQTRLGALEKLLMSYNGPPLPIKRRSLVIPRSKSLDETLRVQWLSPFVASLPSIGKSRQSTRIAVEEFLFHAMGAVNKNKLINYSVVVSQKGELREKTLYGLAGQFWWQVYQYLDLRQKANFWKKLFNEFEEEAINPLAQMRWRGDKIKKSQQLQKAMMRSALSFFGKGHDDAIVKAKQNMLALKPMRVDAVVEFFSIESLQRALNSLEKSKRAQAVTILLVFGDQALLAGRKEGPIFKFDRFEFYIDRWARASCTPPKENEIAKMSQLNRLLYVDYCEGLDDRQGADIDWSWLAFGGTEAFAQANSSVPFVEYHLPSLRLLKKYWPNKKIEAEKYWKLDKALNAYRINSPVEGITLIRPNRGTNL